MFLFVQHLQAGSEMGISAGNTGGYASKRQQPTSSLVPKAAVSSEQQATELYSMAGAGTEPKVLLEDDEAVVVRMSIASQTDRNYSMVGENGFKTPPLKVPPNSDKEVDSSSKSTTAIPAENTYDRAVVKPELDANLRFDVDDLDRKLSGEPPLDCPPKRSADLDAVYSAPVVKHIDPAAHTTATGDLYSHANTTTNYRFIAPSNVEMKGLVAAG